MRWLININGQHDSVGLLNPARHEGILDAYAQNGAVYQEYYAVYRELIKVKKELDAIITDEGEKQRKIDLLSYQVQEIEDASLTAGEEETLAARRKVLANASTIRERISQSYALLSGGDDAPGAVDLLGEASNAIDGAAQLDSGLSAAAGQLLDLYYTAKDLSADLIGRLEGYETNDAELDEIEQRMDLIYKLKRKYGDTVEDIIAFGQQAREELDRIQFSQERTEHLQAEKHRLYVLARDKAEVLTQTRLKAFEELNRRISGTLDFLNMPGVRMTLRHTRGPLASHGQDSVEFYISTNPGEDPKPLAKIASGGELSVSRWQSKMPWPIRTQCLRSSTMRSTAACPARRPAASVRCSNRAQKITRSSASLTLRRLQHWPTAICLSRRISRMNAPIPRSTRWIPRAEWTRWLILFPVTMSRSFPVPMPERCWDWPSMKPVIDNPAELC